MNPVTCALATLMAPSFGMEAGDQTCLFYDVDLAGRASVIGPDAPIPRRLDLSRARLELGLGHGVAMARVAVLPTRSAPEGGYVGIDGESFVPRVQIAEARIAWARAGLSVYGGLIDEPWTLAENQTWGWRALGITGVEGDGLLPREDVGLGATWTSAGTHVRATVLAASGEGGRFRERNGGQTLSAVVDVRPLGDDRLVLSVVGREGSVGVLSARDHRVGFRASTAFDEVRAGASTLAAWGVGGDASRTPVSSALWLAATPGPWAAGTLRVEHRGEGGGHVVRAYAAAGVMPDAHPIELYATTSVDHVDGQLSSVPGVAVTSYTVGLQLGVRLRGAFELTPVERP